MKVVTAAQLRRTLGGALDELERDEAASVIVARRRRPAGVLLNAALAEKLILVGYARGLLPRPVAMRLLGLDWYGHLVDRMEALGIEGPQAPAEAAAKIQASLDALFPPAPPSRDG